MDILAKNRELFQDKLACRIFRTPGHDRLPSGGILSLYETPEQLHGLREQIFDSAKTTPSIPSRDLSFCQTLWHMLHFFPDLSWRRVSPLSYLKQSLERPMTMKSTLAFKAQAKYHNQRVTCVASYPLTTGGIKQSRATTQRMNISCETLRVCPSLMSHSGVKNSTSVFLLRLNSTHNLKRIDYMRIR